MIYAEGYLVGMISQTDPANGTKKNPSYRASWIVRLAGNSTVRSELKASLLPMSRPNINN